MKFIIQRTTDGKYVGHRLSLKSLPNQGSNFKFKDIEFKVLMTEKDKSNIKIVSNNYIIEMIEEKEE